MDERAKLLSVIKARAIRSLERSPGHVVAAELMSEFEENNIYQADSFVFEILKHALFGGVKVDAKFIEGFN
nr:hypothetical protein TetV2_00555 [Oceanusvirus sp.]